MNRQEFDALTARVAQAREELEAATEQLVARCEFDRDTEELMRMLEAATWEPWAWLTDEEAEEEAEEEIEAEEDESDIARVHTREWDEAYLARLLLRDENEYAFLISRHGSLWTATDFYSFDTVYDCGDMNRAKVAAAGLLLKSRAYEEVREANVYGWSILREEVDCPQCDGGREYPGHNCETCKGTGKVPQKET